MRFAAGTPSDPAVLTQALQPLRKWLSAGTALAAEGNILSETAENPIHGRDGSCRIVFAVYRGHVHAAIRHQAEPFPQALEQAPLQQDWIVVQHIAIVAQFRMLGKVQGKRGSKTGDQQRKAML